jgi:oligopeptide transport system ATP-binding protein
MTPSPLLEVSILSKRFTLASGVFAGPKATVHAVDNVSFAIGRGAVLGLVGEADSGKTTIGRSLLRLTEPSGGRVVFDGVGITAASGADLRVLRRRTQLAFQDLFASLDPRIRVGDSIAEPLEAHRIGANASMNSWR